MPVQSTLRNGGRQPEEIAPGPDRRLQLHAPDPVVPLDASLETLANMQSQGKIRLVALSNVGGTHRARPENRADRVGPESIQFCRSRMDNVVDYGERTESRSSHGSPLGAGTVAGRLLERIAKARQ